MTFSVVEEMSVLIQQWKVTSINGLSGSLVAVFSLAVLYQFMSSYHSYLDISSSKRNVTRNPSKASYRLQDHILRTFSYLLTAIAGYLLMLVVATYDVWLFTSILSGAGFGYFLSNPLYTWYSSLEIRRSDRGNNNRPSRSSNKVSRSSAEKPLI